MDDKNSYPKNVLSAVTLLRMFIGWHFFYEGVLKLLNPGWTSKAYLLSAETMTGFYQWLGNDGLVGIVDVINIAGLIFIGLALLLGIMDKPAVITGIVLLLLYYFAHPAFMGSAQIGAEGNYWIINKNLIEAAALLVLYMIPTSHFFGLGVFLKSTLNLKPPSHV